MKNAFYFTLKALFVLSIFTFYLDFLVMWVNGLIRKISLISKPLTSQPGKQIIATHILTKISRSKCNQAMKFGQLIEYNLRNIFLEEWYTKYGGETIRRPFLNNSKLSISLDQYYKVLYILFLLFAKFRTIEIDWD